MKKKESRPSQEQYVKRIFTYVSQTHYQQLLADQKSSNCPSLSQYFRIILSGHKEKITYRDLNEEQALYMMNNLAVRTKELSKKMDERLLTNGLPDHSLIVAQKEVRNLLIETNDILRKLVTLWSLKYTLVKTSPKR